MNKNDIEKKIIKKGISTQLKENELELINNRYYLEEEVGRGGLSIVYKAKDIYSEYFNDSSNKIVLKIPSKELRKKNDISAFVYAEYTFLKKLNHDNIVNVLDFGIDLKKKLPYIVLEYIEGSLLDNILISELTLKEKNKIFRKLYETLNYIHNKNIIHADISPANIFLTKNKEPIIFDFGISHYIKNDSDFTLKYEKIQAFNPNYCSPKLLEKNQSPTINTDMFSFATVMYEIYTSKPLFKVSSKEIEQIKFSNKEIKQIPFLLRSFFKTILRKDEKKHKYKIFVYFFIFLTIIKL